MPEDFFTDPRLSPGHKAPDVEERPADVSAEIVTPITKIKAAVKAGIINTFGFDAEYLEQLLKEGRVVIKVDPENLMATVTFDKSVKLHEGAVNLTDPLGSNQLPDHVDFKLIKNEAFTPGMFCDNEKGSCPDNSTYSLESGSFKVSTMNFNLYYWPILATDAFKLSSQGDNRLHSVSVSEVYNTRPEIMAPTPTRLAPIEGIKYISFKYGEEGNVQAHIAYVSGEIAARTVMISRMLDGRLHIQTVTDLNKDGKVLAVSSFKYSFSAADCAPSPDGTSCQNVIISVSLENIHRADANGKLLSTISKIQKAPIGIPGFESNSYVGTQTFPNGRTLNLYFATTEELLAQALKNESESTTSNLPPAVKSYMDALQQKVGGLFTLAATLQKDGSYLVSMTDFNTRIIAPTSGLHTMSFTLSKSGELRLSPRPDYSPTIQASYYGAGGDIKVSNGNLLFEGMKLLVTGSSDQDALARMSKINVSSVDLSGAIHFRDANGTYLKVFRDVTGNVRLEKEGVGIPQPKITATPTKKLTTISNAASLRLAPVAPTVKKKKKK